MSGEHEAWLAELKREGRLLGPGAVPFAMRGYEWRAEIALAGDFTGHTLIGRVKISPGAASNLAVMDMFGPVLNGTETVWRASLPASGTNSTNSFPADADLDGVARFPFLLVLIPPADNGQPLAGGLLTVLEAI